VTTVTTAPRPPRPAATRNLAATPATRNLAATPATRNLAATPHPATTPATPHPGVMLATKLTATSPAPSSRSAA